MILFFSGTGNSRAVAEELGRLLGDTVAPITPAMRGGRLDMPAGDSRLIWVYPIYSWGVPPYVLEVIRTLEINCSGSLIHHAVVTCGDDCGLADRMWRKAVKSRGWTDGAMMSVQMPNNYVAMKGFDVDSKEVETAKLAVYPARVAEIAARLEQGDGSRGVTDIVRGRFAWLKTRVVYPWFVRNAMNPRRFSASEACIGCGRCARTCPLSNITMTPSHDNPKAQRPTWGSDCAGCLGCYHICSTHAIDYAHATEGKGQYRYHPSK